MLRSVDPVNRSQRTGTAEVMGILRQEVKTASSGLPDNQNKTRFQVCLRRPQRSKQRWRGNKLPLHNTQPRCITNENA